MDFLIKILYLLTSSLLIPVIVALFVLLGWVLFEVGGFISEWYSRKNLMKGWKQQLSKIGDRKLSVAERRKCFFDKTTYPGLIALFAKQGNSVKEYADQLDRIIGELEIKSRENCSKMNLWIRIGPMLGLMGTLIPMGPALKGLSSGNMEEMVTNLVVAFSTTVTGLLIGALCSVMSVIRRHWYVRDLADIEHFMELNYIEVDHEETA